MTESSRNELVKILNLLDHCRTSKERSKLETLYEAVLDAIKWLDNHSQITEKDLLLQILQYLNIIEKEKKLSETFGDFRINYLININIGFYKQTDLKDPNNV